MRTIILDFDGTVADTSVAILATVKSTLEHFNLPTPDEQAIRQVIGLPLRDTFTKAANLTDESLIQACITYYRSGFNDVCKNTILLYPGVKETLAKLRHAGLLITIASSRGKDSLLTLLDTLDIKEYMDIIIGEQDVALTKPAPDMVNLILRQTDTIKEEALVVGDTVFDIMMGKSAGVKTCGVTYGNHTKERLLTSNPDYLVDNFSELTTLILKKSQ